MFHLSYIHPSQEMAHAHQNFVYLEDDDQQQQNRNSSRTSQGEATREQNIGQSILLNKVIIALNIWKFVMFAILCQKQLESYEGHEIIMYSWCQQVAFLGLLEICLKFYCIRIENKEMLQLQSQGQTIELEQQSSYAVNINQPLMSTPSQENLELIPILSDFDVSKLKLYLLIRIKKTESLIGIIIGLIHFALFIYGNIIVFDLKEMQSTFIYKTMSIYLLIGFLIFCVPILFIITIVISIPIIILGFIIFKRNIFSSSPQDDPLFEKRLTNIETVDQLTTKSEFLTKDCSICLRVYNIEDKISKLPCNSNHHFHKDCIMRWLKINNMCPICRFDLNLQSTELRTIERGSSDSENFQFNQMIYHNI